MQLNYPFPCDIINVWRTTGVCAWNTDLESLGKGLFYEGYKG